MEEFDMTPEPFMLIKINIDGVEIEARPHEWKHDDGGNPIAAVAYRTTCPHCSQLVEFRADDLRDMAIYCTECGRGKDKWDVKNDAMLMEKSYPDSDPGLRSGELIEPIMAGLMEMP